MPRCAIIGASCQPAVMSIEYTIDIQLTELGFPDILQPLDTSVRETPLSDDSLSPSHSSLSTTHKQRLLVPGKQSVGKGAATTKQNSDIKTRCKPLNPAQNLQDGHTEEELPTAHHPTAGPGIADPPQLTTEQNDSREEDDDGDTTQEVQQEEEEADSDDSEVSGVYEEEELEEEEDYENEEGLSNESSHSGDYRCSVCDLQLPSKFKLQDHMNLHTGARPYCCAECGKRFCQIYSYRVHLRTHAKTKVDRLLCRICLKDFVSQEDLNRHLSRTHFEDEFYECDQCKRVFTNLKACEYHVQLNSCMQNVVCEVCGRNFSSSKSLTRHRKKSCHRNFKCTDCAKIFTKKNALLKHSFSHLGLLPYTCVRCRCHFRLAKLYRQHKCEPQRIHCVACLREFLSQQDFQQHKKDTGCWGNQEPKGDEIRCLECGQRFDTSEELKKHAGAHQRVLKCAECGKGFRSALLLMSHMGGHAGKSPCLCQSCGLGFPHQQNYDSHLKMCGKTPKPASAPKKRQASKRSSPETEKLNGKPDSSDPAHAVTTPAAPLNGSSSPGLVTEGVSAGSGTSDGLWKLTLDKQPPPGVKLVLFLPVCPTQTNGLTLPSEVSPALQGPAIQVQPQHLAVNAALGAQLSEPLDLVTGIKQDPEYEFPLDLSKRSTSYKSLSSVPLLPVKSEPEDFDISGEAESTVRPEFKNSEGKAIVRPHPGETDRYTEVKKFKMGPMDLSTPNVNTSSSGLTLDIKNDTLSPGPGPNSDLWSSTSCQLGDKKIKMEIDI